MGGLRSASVQTCFLMKVVNTDSELKVSGYYLARHPPRELRTCYFSWPRLHLGQRKGEACKARRPGCCPGHRLALPKGQLRPKGTEVTRFRTDQPGWPERLRNLGTLSKHMAQGPCTSSYPLQRKTRLNHRAPGKAPQRVQQSGRQASLQHYSMVRCFSRTWG